MDTIGGVCYFLWERNSKGTCEIITHKSNNVVDKSQRFLLEPFMTTFLRYKEQISILKKVRTFQEKSFSDIITANDPFGFDIREAGSYKRVKPNYLLSKFNDAVELYYNGWRKNGVGYIQRNDIRKNKELIDKYKIFIPKAWGKGDPLTDSLNSFVGRPNSACTETYLLVGPFKNEEETLNALSYMKTKFFHFMVSMMKITQNSMKNVYTQVPQQDYSKPWTDEELYTKYNLTKEEIAFIESMIHPME